MSEESKTVEFEALIEKFDFNHWQHHVPIPEEFLSDLMDNEHRRVMVWVDELGPFHMAVLKAKTCWYLLLNKEIRTKISKDVGHPVKIRCQRDHSEFGHEVPEEFSILLDQDEEAGEIFHALTKGKQRSLVYLVTKVKNPESRMKKSLAIMHHLRLSKGNLDYKQLNELIKYYNNL